MKMEKKEKPEVPDKPRLLSVSDKARNFEKIAASINIEKKPIKLQRKETIIKEPKPEIDVIISAVVDDSYDDIAESEINDESSNESSDDSIYFETPQSPEHIYDEILQDSGVANIVEEILTNEKSYIERLNYMFENYVESSRDMGEQMQDVFGNVEEIKRFHENTFYPDLQRCHKDLIRILECFSGHIKIGNFYIYVVYAINKKKSDDARIIPAIKDFFRERQQQIDDKLGLHSYLTEPFQRFFKYQNLMESVLKKITINDQNFMEIAATSRALSDVKKLLNTANKSMEVTDIVDSKINLMNQGNFLNQNGFNIFDYNHKRKYKGKLFLFQKCVVCTECTSGKLQFRSYFPDKIGLIECLDENKFILSERNNYKIEVSGDSNIIQQWMEHVRKILKPVPEENRHLTISDAPSRKISEPKRHSQIAKDLELIFDTNLLRSASSDFLRCEMNATANVEHRQSNSDCSSVDSGVYLTDSPVEKLPFKEMIKSIDTFYEKVNTNKRPLSDNIREHVITDEITFAKPSADDIIQEMLNNEKDYVGQLTIGIQTYLNHENASITESFRSRIFKMFGNFQQIKEFHENTFYGALSDCGNDVTKIANVFSKFTQEGLFSNYILYAMTHSNTQSNRNMKIYREFFEARQKEVDDNQGVEYYLFLPFKHLSMYQFYMEQIIDTLDIITDTPKMAACSKARKNVERLIKDMHKSWTSADNHVKRKPIRRISNLIANGINHNIFKRN